MPVKVHLEPEDVRHMDPENCVDCRQPTRYWLTPHIPLCPHCASKRTDDQFMIQIDEIIDEATLRGFAKTAAHVKPDVRHVIDESFLWEEGQAYYQGQIAALRFAYQLCADSANRNTLGAAISVLAEHMVKKGWW